MTDKDSKENCEFNKSEYREEEKSNSSSQDFFDKLQQNEAKNGTTVRGKGHNWTTLIESMLGDW